MEPEAGDTQPLPVVETVAARPVPPATAALPADPPPAGSAPFEPPPRRDRTPLLLGLLALAAVLALVLSLMALARRDSPAAPPGLVDPAATTMPSATVPPATAPPTTVTTSAPTPTTRPVVTTSGDPAVAPSPPGKGKGAGGGGKGKD